MPIPQKRSIPGRKPRGGASSDADLGNLLGGMGGLLESLLKGLGKTVESIQNLSKEDLEKLVELAEAQGNEEARKNLEILKEAMGKGGIDLSKLVKIQSGVRGHFMGRPFGGGLPLDRREPQETKFEVKGTRPKRASKIEEVRVQEPEMEVYQEGDHIKVVSEMSGVEETNIRCEIKEEGRVLRISAEGRKKYEKEISLPAQVSQANWRYQNGILEITLTKKSGA